MNTTELTNHLSLAVAALVDTRVSNFGDLHKRVAELTEPILMPHGLEYNTWFVRPVENEGYSSMDLWRFDLDLREDKNAKHSRRGRIISASFRRAVDGETLQDMIRNHRRKDLEEQIQSLVDAVRERESDIARFNSEIQKRQTEVSALDELRGTNTGEL